MSRHGVYYTKSPLLASRTPVWRSRFVIVCLALGFTALTARAAWVQLYRYEFYQNQADMRYIRSLSLPASRGEIRDRNGVLLATSIEASSVQASRADVQITPEQLTQLAALLEMRESTLQERLEPRGGSNYVYLRRLISPEVAQQVRALEIKGISLIGEYRRFYPHNETTAHILGYTSVDHFGQAGVELAFENVLAGKPGHERYIRDSLGQAVGGAEDRVEPVNGQDIQLSIDQRIQSKIYEILVNAVTENNAVSGSIVILDVQTGEILALVNYPSYNPNERSELTGDNLKNRAVTDSYEPGSTVKPIIIARALDLGLVTPTTMIRTAQGSVVVSGKVIRDVVNYPQLTVQQIIQKSSNVGVVYIAMQMDRQEIWETFTALGFGLRPIEFPGATSGKLRPYETWRPIEQATQAYGYGLSVSLLQLSRAYLAFARPGGDIIPLSLLYRGDEQPVQGIRVFTPETVAEIREMLHMVTLPGGGATRAQVEGYSVGGKSGTAIKLSASGEYDTGRYRSWFVGIAPVSQPRIVVGVMLDEPNRGNYYGGAVAAPIFSQVVQSALTLLGVAPDEQSASVAAAAGDRAHGAASRNGGRR